MKKKYYDFKKLNNDVINVRISSVGYGKCYHEVKKDIIDNIKKDIIYYSLSLDEDEKFIIHRVLTIIEQYYFK